MMHIPQITNKQLLQLLQSYWQWRWLWLGTTLAFGLLGLVYALALKKDTWVASQGLIVRDEANGAVMRLGRFQSQTEMKAAQETILEMAHNPQVLRNALLRVGKASGWISSTSGANSPTSGEIESLAQNGIEVRAPRGAEFGTTEMIYIDIKDSTPARALELNVAVCDELTQHLQEVRQVRADGVVAELTTAARRARESLDVATQRLAKIEQASGVDLSDLRGLTETNSGGSNSRQLLDSLKRELQTVELEHQEVQAELALAQESFKNPDRLLAAPAKLLARNPGMLKLREGLAEAVITTSQLRGKYTLKYPSVIAARDTETKIRDQLRSELGIAVATLQQDLVLSTERISRLKEQKSQLEDRLEKLANVRAEYGNIDSEVRSLNEQLQDAERELAQAVASREAAVTSSLVTRLDEPIVGENPVGPGRATILAGAAVSGLMFGLGIVFLLSPMQGGGLGYGRRTADVAAVGRRASDQFRVAGVGVANHGFNRRGDDTPAPVPTAAEPRSQSLVQEPDPQGIQAQWAGSDRDAVEGAQLTDRVDHLAAAVEGIATEGERRIQAAAPGQTSPAARTTQPVAFAPQPHPAAVAQPAAAQPARTAQPAAIQPVTPIPPASRTPEPTPQMVSAQRQATQHNTPQPPAEPLDTPSPGKPGREVSFSQHASTIAPKPKPQPTANVVHAPLGQTSASGQLLPSNTPSR